MLSQLAFSSAQGKNALLCQPCLLALMDRPPLGQRLTAADTMDTTSDSDLQSSSRGCVVLVVVVGQQGGDPLPAQRCASHENVYALRDS